MAHVLILGGGFAGLVVAERLSAQLDHDHQITIVAPNDKFIFYPAMVQLAFGACEVSDLTIDLRSKFGELGVRFIQGELIRIDPAQQTAEIAGPDFNGDIAYDYVVFAMGRRLATERVPGFFEHASHLLGTKAALKFGQKIRDFSEGTIVLGSCPEARLPVPVCETAFALSKKFESEIREGKVRIKVVFPDSLQAAFGGAVLHKELETAFNRRGIIVLYDIPVTEVHSDHIASSAGHKVNYELLMLVPPFRGHAILGDLGITDQHDYINVDGHMQVRDLSNAFAIGDIAALPGPKFGHMAVRQADIAASNLASRLAGELPVAFYEHEIATIIDAGGSDSIYLHYGIWDDTLYSLKKGHVWGWAKEIHDRLWRSKHG